MFYLAPSVYAADIMELRKQIDILEEAGVKYLHVDIMDGHFVPLMAFGPDVVAALKKNSALNLDVHLMIDNPESKLTEFAEAGADVITIHLEACKDPEACIDKIHSSGVKAGIALKPETEISAIPLQLWKKIDVLQIMTVQPGRKGQHFMSEMLSKIRKAKSMITDMEGRICIEVDGDITLDHLPQVLNAGADIVVVGKAIFKDDIRTNVKKYIEIGQTEGDQS